MDPQTPPPPIKSLQAMTFHDINPATKLNIMGMFEKGYTPSLAHKELIKVSSSQKAT